MTKQLQLTAQIQLHQLGQRLDQALAECFPDYSRSRIKTWIEQDLVQVNGAVVNKPREKVYGDEVILIEVEIEEENRFVAQPIALNIVYEDDDILVINKPKDFVVHPGAGNPDGTVLNALLHHYPQIAEVPRAGIVHRLDKDTTGLMVVAKTIPAQTRLVYALQKRRITREYEAVAYGIMTKGGTIDQPMSRHPTKRTHMAVHPMGKPAVTHYRIMERFRNYTRLRLRLETGRTHQIRVHMAHIAHPLLGDQVYGGRPRPPKGASEEFLTVLRNFQRQALHAVMLRLEHPISGEVMEWHAPLPDDFVELLNALKQDYELHKDELDY
ncbi:23S rRNA pseudouridine(1911/1915/1917) synthase RluD [Testudinibacter sp. TR-2022]|uniref:23S rRNA pseudouridine(1911/1915/1917) synthase RluD n=1 Tax=Testudinibacter sp. TR-2022 TaxID=2585029 RepID=UPI00111AC10D|nr:23S rRNA pseudouridine(1911/1915/1917) synthase RluD [Testudinibacter sp. TR-2022]TNH04993.1 23S rRNA pseudouridine(1911/1915/1917) synthase RluD [Pasteurellaceae bacterium Phil31]TNH05274.1 23S rRNA pseudouridine(1911/1915/1917) synthase RluD [Testudinibacter sp. TR-2022]TNH10548.1 23S rRNA pseudouridine(1911/1915/1917) synthase RluD [Testudinibacter sp. TR-2022]TNH13503.1 23S rRNA pseudouridine(1911/1915/1917) synthase RluD [Testudinibacter sp. TR-2022]TNH19128.1 23S rRNA pseudouridine(19